MENDILWSETVGSGFKELGSTTLQRIPRSTPQDGFEDIPWTWMTLFTLSKIWKIQGRRGPTALLSFIMFLQTNICIHVPFPSPKCRRLFMCLVWFGQFFVVTTQLPEKCKKNPLVSRVHPKAYVTIVSLIFSLTSSSGIFKGHGYAFAG